MEKPILTPPERFYEVNWTAKVILISLFFIVSRANAATAIFWHAATQQDTLLVEKVAQQVATNLQSSIELLSPDLLHTKLSDVAFENLTSARAEFFKQYPAAKRIDISFRRFGSVATAICYVRTAVQTDSLRIFYPGQNEDVADWMGYKIENWISPKNKITKPADFASIVIDGSPTGAEIAIDGVNTGQRIPCRFDNLSSGMHLIELLGASVAAKGVRLTANTVVGVQLRGKEARSLIEILTDPPGINVSIDGASSGATPYLRASNPGSYSIAVGGGDREEIVRLIDVEPHEWRTLQFFPQPMTRVVVQSNPPGAVLYNGPVRIGTAGDTLPCSPTGEEWTADHPYANPHKFMAKGRDGKVVNIEVNLPPALSFLSLKNYYFRSRVAIDDSTIKFARSDSVNVISGKRQISISTPGFRNRTYSLVMERGQTYTIESKPIAAPSWRSASISAVVPGLGQYFDGSEIRGALYFVATVVALNNWRKTEATTKSSIDYAQVAEVNYRKSLTKVAAQYWSAEADTRWRDAKTSADSRNRWVIATTAVWTMAVLDRLVFPTKELEPAAVGSGTGIKMSFPIPGGSR